MKRLVNITIVLFAIIYIIKIIVKLYSAKYTRRRFDPWTIISGFMVAIFGFTKCLIYIISKFNVMLNIEICYYLFVILKMTKMVKTFVIINYY